MKKIYEEVYERSKGLCELCGSNEQTELHHIVSGVGKRKMLESPENCIMLCYKHHRGTYGVHGREGAELNKQLKRTLQGYYKAKGYDEDTIRNLMGGKLY